MGVTMYRMVFLGGGGKHFRNEKGNTTSPLYHRSSKPLERSSINSSRTVLRTASKWNVFKRGKSRTPCCRGEQTISTSAHLLLL